MAHKITKWSPDTCDCKVNIIWDTNVPDTHTLEIEQPCSIHAGEPDPAGKALGRNRLKNTAVGNINPEDPSSVQWSFRPDGKLEIKIPSGLTRIEAESRVADIVPVVLIVD